MHILNYKTSSRNNHASFSYKLDEELGNHIRKHIKEINTKERYFPLFLNSKKEPFIKVQTMANNRHKTCSFIGYFKYLYFNRTKRIITPTTLRKSLVTHLMEINTEEREMKEVAQAMLHSHYTQQRYYSKLSSQQKADKVKKFINAI